MASNLNTATGNPIDPSEGGPQSVSLRINDNGTLKSVMRSMMVTTGSAQSATHQGTADAEAIYAEGGNDTAFGGAGDDLLDGGTGNDALYGQAGHDDLRGGAGMDSLYGGAGNDVLEGGADADLLVGGANDDLYIVADSTDTIIEQAGEGTDTMFTSLKVVTLPANVERLVADVAKVSSVVYTGNALNNTLIGTAGNDQLDGGAGADTMQGGAGNDFYRVDNVGDVIVEAFDGGHDTARVSLSSYTMPANVDALQVLTATGISALGNPLDNMMTGGAGDDSLWGGLGNDTLTGGDGVNLLYGGMGNDTFVLNYGTVGYSDIIEYSGHGTDTLRSNNGSIYLPANVENLEFFVTINANGTLLSPASFLGVGNELNNVISGWSLADTLVGGAGNDTLKGDSGADLLIGEDGDDFLDGGVGADNMDGGIGNDSFVVDNAGDSVYGGPGVDTVHSLLNTYTMPAANLGVDNVVFIGSGSFKATGNDLANVMQGAGGNDSLMGSHGADTLEGNAGNDYLDGGFGNDVMRGGTGDDWYEVDSQGDVIFETAGQGYDLITTFLMNYTVPAGVERIKAINDGPHNWYANSTGVKMEGGTGMDVFTGGAGVDELRGNQGDDYLQGAFGDDALYGGAGNDKLFGGNDNDKLYGEAGSDTLEGGYGNDTLVGGEGADRFVFGHATVSAGSNGNDKVLDFTPGVDKLDFSAIDGNAAIAGDQPLAFCFQGAFAGGGQASLRYDIVGNSTMVYVDSNGDGFGDFSIELVGQTGFLAMADLVL